MPSGEIPLITGPLPPCRGADLATNPDARRRRTRGNPTVTIRPDLEVLFACDQETAAGRCLLAPAKLACAVRPIFIPGLSPETLEIGRRTIAVKGGILDYDPTERVVYDWPNKPRKAEPQTLRTKENIILAQLVETPGKAVRYDTLWHALWPDELPDTAETQLQKHMSSLRGKIGGELIETVQELGYRLLTPENTTTT